MSSSDFLPFATGGSANVESQVSYSGSGHQINGFQSGLAQSNQVNKAVRQATFGVAAIAQFMLNQLGINIPDDGNLSNFVTNFEAAIWKSVVLTGVCTAPTQGATDNSTKLANTAFAQAMVAAIIANSPGLGGNPTTPNQATGDNSTRIANTAFVQALIAFIIGNSPALGGDPTAPTQVVSDVSTRIATTEFVKNIFSSSFNFGASNPGYIQLPAVLGGFIAQWGIVNAVHAAFTGFSFSIPFPNAGLAIFCNYASSVPPGTGAVGVDFVDNTSGKIWNSAPSGSNNSWWLALGY